MEDFQGWVSLDHSLKSESIRQWKTLYYCIATKPEHYPKEAARTDMIKRLFRGIGANFLGQIINIASRIVLVPLFLLSWGADIYGEWLLLSSMVAYLSLIEMGDQLYIVNRKAQGLTGASNAQFGSYLSGRGHQSSLPGSG